MVSFSRVKIAQTYHRVILGASGNGERLTAMDLLEGLHTTRSIRRYTDEPVSDEALAAMMFAATRAPTGSNRQNYRMVVLRDGPNAQAAKRLIGDAAREAWQAKSTTDGYDRGSGGDPSSPKARMARAMRQYVDNFESCPLVVLPCLIERHGNIIDGASIYPACQNLLLAARALGYGGVLTGWHGGVAEGLRELLAIPNEFSIAATITIGRPVGSHGPVRRRPLQELVFDDGWGHMADWAIEPEGTRHTQAGPPKR